MANTNKVTYDPPATWYVANRYSTSIATIEVVERTEKTITIRKPDWRDGTKFHTHRRHLDDSQFETLAAARAAITARLEKTLVHKKLELEYAQKELDGWREKLDVTP